MHASLDNHSLNWTSRELLRADAKLTDTALARQHGSPGLSFQLLVFQLYGWNSYICTYYLPFYGQLFCVQTSQPITWYNFQFTRYIVMAMMLLFTGIFLYETKKAKKPNAQRYNNSFIVVLQSNIVTRRTGGFSVFFLLQNFHYPNFSR